MAFGAGLNCNQPLLMSDNAMLCPAVTATPLSVNKPAPGSVLILTANRPLAGESLGSVNPKSLAANVSTVSSNVVTVLSVPDGASLTELTVIVTVALFESSNPSFALYVNVSVPLKLAFGI